MEIYVSMDRNRWELISEKKQKVFLKNWKEEKQELLMGSVWGEATRIWETQMSNVIDIWEMVSNPSPKVWIKTGASMPLLESHQTLYCFLFSCAFPSVAGGLAAVKDLSIIINSPHVHRLIRSEVCCAVGRTSGFRDPQLWAFSSTVECTVHHFSICFCFV